MCNPPTFRVTANDEQWVLVASASCSCCRGSGELHEAHGETLPCGCAFEDASPEVLDAIDAGAAFVIEPNPAWVEFMDQMYRALRGGE